MSPNPYNNNNYNEWLDYYFYEIGVNVIAAANSTLKRPIILSETKIEGYGIYNIVDDDDDSIHAVDIKELATYQDQVFISEDKLEESVNRIINHRLGPYLNNKK